MLEFNTEDFTVEVLQDFLSTLGEDESRTIMVGKTSLIVRGDDNAKSLIDTYEEFKTLNEG